MRRGGFDRGVSPVVGVALLLGILVVLVAVVSVSFIGFSTELSSDPVETVVGGGEPESDSTGAPYSYDDNLTAVDNNAGATTRHIVTLNVTGNAVGNSLNQLTIDYTSGSTNVSETAAGETLEHLLVIGIDTDADGYTDKDAMSDVETSDFNAENSGSKLVIELTGNYNLNAADKLVVVYEQVENPSSTGTFDADLNLNGDRVYDGSLSIN